MTRNTARWEVFLKRKKESKVKKQWSKTLLGAIRSEGYMLKNINGCRGDTSHWNQIQDMKFSAFDRDEDGSPDHNWAQEWAMAGGWVLPAVWLLYQLVKYYIVRPSILGGRTAITAPIIPICSENFTWFFLITKACSNWAFCFSDSRFHTLCLQFIRNFGILCLNFCPFEYLSRSATCLSWTFEYFASSSSFFKSSLWQIHLTRLRNLNNLLTSQNIYTLLCYYLSC